MTTFVDGIVLTQKHYQCDGVRELAGVRSMAYREKGDICRDGSESIGQEIIGEQFRPAWIQGSHSTAIRVKSEDGMVTLAGNPGRWGRADNLFNLDLAGTVEASNRIVQSQGLPGFSGGEPIGSARVMPTLTDQGYMMASGGNLDAVDYVLVHPDGTFRQGARVWSIHVTRNYVTGSEANAVAVLNWLDSQSVARVKKKRFGKSTVVWGNLNYCQVEAYLKADELMDHCKGDLEREAMRQNPAYQWSKENGIVRIEVKAAKDYLRDRALTHLGAWTMEKVIDLFDERTEVLHRVKTDIEEFDPATLPSKLACTASAWLRGEDVSRLLSVRTFYRHAKALRDYGIDISEKRNITVMPYKIRTIEMHEASIPDWYDLKPTFPALKVAV
ncbi:phage/plasmid replication protein [Propionivibrio sp.]|uniref:phage/plasmid replication domain-containing protein n=1 Tax=Propionivibrio sp. TaxID=2212460 RepID=UPI002620DB8B|nr:phage/plasmid replication protein [Propionivibrio sp.]